MDRWRYFAITHRDHVICNPTSLAKLDELIGLLDLRPGARVLDVACGKAEFLARMVERCAGSGVGVDASPQFAAAARDRLRQRGLARAVLLHEQDGADYDGTAASFDVASCLGASWIWGGHRGTLQALARFARPGGRVLVGEPYWRTEPDPDYLAAAELTREMFGTHAANLATGVELGLIPLFATASTLDEWDRYEGLQWRAAETWAVAYPDDPDRDELLRRLRHERDTYLRWGRDTLGWALYLFAKP